MKTKEQNMSKNAINILVTSGGTDCYIDDVRVVSNIGTGTFGSQLAEEFLKKGCNVIYLYSRGAKKPIYRHLRVDDIIEFDAEIDKIKEVYSIFHDFIKNITFIEVDDFDDYEEKLLNLTEKIDIWIMAMAVSDYRPIRTTGKISSNDDQLNLKMEKCPKIITKIRDKYSDAFIVGFKLSSNSNEEKIIKNVSSWIEKSNVDMCVANDMSGRNGDYREVYLLKNNTDEYGFYKGPDVSNNIVEDVLAEYYKKINS